MSKFEISQYNKLWSNEGREIMRAIIGNPDLITQKHRMWATKFRIDSNVTPTDAHGKAVFTSYLRPVGQGDVMDLRAPLGDSNPADTVGTQYYTGVIPDLIAKGFRETATERYYKEKYFEQFGDAQLLAQYATEEVQRLVDSANKTLSIMSGALLSTGQITYMWGSGIKGNVLKADIPAENFLNAGSAAWSDTTFPLLTHLRDTVEEINAKLNVNFKWQLEITSAQWRNNFLNNTEVVNWIKYTNALKFVNVPNGFPVTEEMAKSSLREFEGLPEIVIVDETVFNTENGLVNSWADGTAVLRPVGYAGYIRHTNILDEEMQKFKSSVVSKNFVKLPQIPAYLVNTVLNNGNYKEWHTDLMMSAVPSLDEFLYHFIIDTTTAESN